MQKKSTHLISGGSDYGEEGSALEIAGNELEGERRRRRGGRDFSRSSIWERESAIFAKKEKQIGFVKTKLPAF